MIHGDGGGDEGCKSEVDREGDGPVSDKPYPASYEGKDDFGVFSDLIGPVVRSRRRWIARSELSKGQCDTFVKDQNDYKASACTFSRHLGIYWTPTGTTALELDPTGFQQCICETRCQSRSPGPSRHRRIPSGSSNLQDRGKNRCSTNPPNENGQLSSPING